MAAVTDECRETFEEDIALRGRGRANSQWLRVFLKGAADPATFVNWPSCKEYDLVDAWEEEDQPLLGQAQYRMLPWPEVARFVVALPDEVAQRLPDARFDYVYLDDRRDYCRTAEEIAQWWPELRPGGDPGGGTTTSTPRSRARSSSRRRAGERAQTGAPARRPQGARWTTFVASGAAWKCTARKSFCRRGTFKNHTETAMHDHERCCCLSRLVSTKPFAAFGEEVFGVAPRAERSWLRRRRRQLQGRRKHHQGYWAGDETATCFMAMPRRVLR